MFFLPERNLEVVETVNRGRGVFARLPVEAGTVIGDYLGTVIRPAEDDDARGGLYGMDMHDNAVIYPDKDSVGIHLINHSCMPNLGMYPYRGHMLYIALRHIFPGEEFTVSYMVYPPLSFMTKSLAYPCYCQTPLCRGSMLVSLEKAKAYWDGFVRKESGGFYNHLPVGYGEKLPALESYPDVFDDHDIFDLYGATGEKPVELTGEAIPSISIVRKTIRKTGRFIWLPNVSALILGVSGQTYFLQKRSD